MSANVLPHFPVSLADGSRVEIVRKEIIDPSNPHESVRLNDAAGNVYKLAGGYAVLVELAAAAEPPTEEPPAAPPQARQWLRLPRRGKP